MKLWLTVALIGLMPLIVEGSATVPSWPNACGDGRVDVILDNFDSTWVICCTADSSIPSPKLIIVPGCNGNAMAVVVHFAGEIAATVFFRHRRLSGTSESTANTYSSGCAFQAGFLNAH